MYTPFSNRIKIILSVIDARMIGVHQNVKKPFKSLSYIHEHFSRMSRLFVSL